MKVLSPVAAKLLTDRTYDIEFRGYLSNHAKHAIVALDRLEASPERIQEYWNGYTHMTPYNLQLHKVDQLWNHVEPVVADRHDFEALRGTKQHWQAQVDFLNRKLQTTHNNDTNALLTEYAPKLLTVPSLAGALTHGIIHLGWAVDADSPWMIVEGLAYLNFAAIGFDPSFLKMDQHDDATPMDSLIHLAQTWEDDQLADTWVAHAKREFEQDTFHPELAVAGFQREVAKVMAATHPITTEMPTWLTQMEVEVMYKSVYQMTVWLYLATRDENGNGSFVLMHLLSSLWGLEQVLRVVDEDPSQSLSLTRSAIAQWFANLTALVAASSGGFPSATVLQQVRSSPEFAADKIDDTTLNWTPIVERGIAEEEEHNIKLVYVTRELWRRYGHWHGYSEAAKAFVLTPNIGPDEPQFDA